MWYLTKKVKPNLVLLNHAIAQSTGKKSKLDMAGLQTCLIRRLEETNFKEVHSDLENFVQDSLELRTLSLDNFLTLLS
ncbi:MAG: hypothetical protein EBR67_02655 [Proteobacteria bacterium]|nr:hypothetical protein [Pseudomonadota bacterium]